MKMESWSQRRLGQLLEIKHGFAFKGEYFSDAGEFVLLTPGNFREEGGLKLKGEKEKYYSGSFPDEYLLCRGDLLVAMTDLIQNAPILGSPAFIPGDKRYLHNQRLGKIVNLNTDEVLPEFLFYLLNTASVRAQIKGSATGATVRHTSPSRIYEVAIELPPLPTQRRIAGILSAYDELIENNQRRIRILEEMARSLYREWFVHFRYPGHESVPLVDSPLGQIPQGWEVKKLGDISDIKWGDTSKTKSSYVEEGYAAYSASGLDGKMNHYDFNQLGIVLSAIGAQCGKTWLAREKWSCIKNTIRFWSKDDCVSTEFLFVATDGQNFWPRRGAAQPFISQGDAERIELLISDRVTMKQFTLFVANAFKHISTLQEQTANLRRTRDLLLPRLLSGKIHLLPEDVA